MKSDRKLRSLYRPCSPRTNESFNGFLLRLATENRYAGIDEVLCVARTVGAHIPSNLIDIRCDAAALAELGRLSSGNPDNLLRYRAKDLAKEAIYFHDCRIDRDALLARRSQVCPACLRESGYADAGWDLACVTACSKHHSLLLDACPSCAAPIAWNRPHLFRCGNCAYDLRSAADRTADEHTLWTSSDFEALAAFRVVIHGDVVETLQWDSMYRVFKLLLLEDRHFVCREWPEHLLNSTAHDRRLAVAQAIGRTRRRDAYQITGLRRDLIRHAEFLNAIPKPSLANDQIRAMAHGEAGLPMSVASALADDVAWQPQPSGASLFGGRPPKLRSPEDVAGFLGADMETLARLGKLGILHRPLEDDLGHDIDEVLECERFLSRRLMTLSDLRQWVGLPLDWEDLQVSGLLPRWNPGASLDQRTALSDVLSLANRLKWSVVHLPVPLNPTRLGDASAALARPFLFAAHVVNLVLGGGVSAASWASPFRLADLLIEKDHIETLLDKSRTVFGH